MKRDELRNARRAAGLTALALSERTGIREDRIFLLERGRGRVRKDEGLALAAALHATPETLFPGSFDTAGGGRHDS